MYISEETETTKEMNNLTKSKYDFFNQINIPEPSVYQNKSFNELLSDLFMPIIITVFLVSSLLLINYLCGSATDLISIKEQPFYINNILVEQLSLVKIISYIFGDICFLKGIFSIYNYCKNPTTNLNYGFVYLITGIFIMSFPAIFSFFVNSIL